MVHKTSFTCSREGRILSGYEYRGDHCNRIPVVLSHGFLANQSMGKGYARQLAAWGYAAYTFDFCGGGLGSKSDGRLSEMSVLTEKADLLAMIDYLHQQTDLDCSRLLLLGMSQGGFVSALLAAEHPQLVAGLILFYPALCIPDDARRGQMMMFRFDPTQIPDLIRWGPLRLGRSYPESVLQMDAIESIRSYPGPVLIVHGIEDRIVTASYAEAAAAAYPDARLVLLSGAGHGFRGKADRDAMQAVRSFLHMDRD